MRLFCAVQLASVVLVAHVQTTQGLSWSRSGRLSVPRQVNPPKESIAPSEAAADLGSSGTASDPSETLSFLPSSTPPGASLTGTTTTSRSRTTTTTRTHTPAAVPMDPSTTRSRTSSSTRTTRPPSDDFGSTDSPAGTTSSRAPTTRPTTSTRSTSRRTTTRTSTSTRPPPSSTGGENETESQPPPSGPTTSSQDDSSSRSVQSGSSAVESTATSDSPFLPPVPSGLETTSSDARELEPASQSPSPTALADQAGNRSILHNPTATALIFTFTALLAIAIVGLLLYCCFWRRRQQHILLGDGDSDGQGHVGILRANSTGSRSTATRRPMSALSALSDGHYLPARFAGVPPINRQHGFDAAHIENDPFSVHRIVYPDPPGPGSEGHGSRRSYMLYPDPVPPAMPIRIVPPRPPQPLAAIIAAAGLSTVGNGAAPAPTPTPAELRSPPRSPTRVKVPALPQSLSGSSLGHGYDSDPHDSARAQSPDSHYEDDGVYQPPPPRTFLIDRRPDTSKRRSQ